MSELKAYLCIQARKIENKTFSCYSQTLAVKNAPEASMAEVYLKSEADKVIADKDKQIEELKHQRDGAFRLANLGLTLEDLTKLARKEIDRQKCKRCLAMAKWCGLEQERIELIENQDITDDDFDKLVKGFYKKWRKRWLELAKKFKEAK